MGCRAPYSLSVAQSGPWDLPSRRRSSGALPRNPAPPRAAFPAGTSRTALAAVPLDTSRRPRRRPPRDPRHALAAVSPGSSRHLRWRLPRDQQNAFATVPLDTSGVSRQARGNRSCGGRSRLRCPTFHCGPRAPRSEPGPFATPRRPWHPAPLPDGDHPSRSATSRETRPGIAVPSLCGTARAESGRRRLP